MEQQKHETFGALVRRHRLRRGWTQAELAERSSLSVEAVGALERGTRRAPFPGTVARIAAALGLSPEQRDELTAAARAPDGEPVRVTPPLPPTNIPQDATTFIGREREVEAVSRLMRDPHVRLLTLTGPGGAGKTRLAIQVGRSLLQEYPDGVFLISLAPVSDPALVLSSVADALALNARPGDDALERVARSVQGKRSLLILDNYEHVLGAASDAATLLDRCSELDLLVTSRAPLRVAREHQYAVPPLSLPHPSRSSRPEELSQSDAVCLFVDRARAVKADFELTEETAPPVAAICTRLDGLPLAIELAAARVRVFAPSALLARLDDRLGLLTTGPRDVPARQQTLRATIEWSHALLTDGERRVFRRLSVFAGGCTVETAEAVCGEEGYARDVLPALESLVDQSLLAVDEEPDEPRFRMLETIREYALEQLSMAGETDDVRRRHAEAFLQLAEGADPGRPAVEDAAWLAQMEREHDNLQAALAWGLEPGTTGELALRLSAALAWFWEERGYSSQGREWLERALARCTSSGYIEASPRAQAQALAARGLLAHGQGDQVAARSYVEQGLAAWRSLGDRRGIASTLVTVGWVMQLQGDHVRGRAAFQELAELAREDGNIQLERLSLTGLANAEKLEGNLAAARVHFEEALALVQRSGTKLDALTRLVNLAEIAWAQGDAAGQRVFYEDALIAMAAMTDEADRLSAFPCINWISCRIGDYERAEEFALEECSLVRAHASKRGRASFSFGLAEVARCRGDWERAAALLGEGLADLETYGERAGIAAVLHNLGHVLLPQGDAGRARTLFLESLTLFRELGFPWSVADCVMGLAGAAGLEGQPEQAALLYGAAEASHQAADMSGTWATPANALAWKWEMSAARSQIDEATWERMWRAGRAMSIDEALAQAGLAREGSRRIHSA